MKTIEPNTDEDLINNYFVLCDEQAEWMKTSHSVPTMERLAVLEAYVNCKKMFEKNIKERGLYN